MKVDKNSMLFYLVTDRTWLGDNDLASQVEDAIKAGATFVQMREKRLGFDDFVAEAQRVKAVTDRYHVPFVINDRIEVARAIGADGVHVGQGDISAKDVRKMLGDNKIIGVSAHTVEQALIAQRAGADYLGVGAVFATATKQDASTVPLSTMREICETVSIPVVAIGGINADNIMQLKGSGVDGVAVISAVFAQKDIAAASRSICELSRRMVKG